MVEPRDMKHVPNGLAATDPGGSDAGPAAPRPAGIDDTHVMSPGEHRPISGRIGPGARIRQYLLLRELGRGGQGQVFLARDEELGRPVALKTIGIVTALSEGARRRFQNEARAVALLQHPGIVQLYEVFEEKRMPFLAMEYIEGDTLLNAIRAGGLDRRRIVEIIAQTAETIGFAHRMHMIHRDLKPHNIMLTPDGQVKVTDFGLARSLRDESGLASATTEGQIIGSPAYMSPEQALGDMKLLGPESDVYSLGVVLYQCLTGCLPFTSDTPAEVMYEILHEDPEPLIKLDPTVGQDLNAICSKAMEKAPSLRYPDADALAKDLRRYLNNEPIDARRTTLTDQFAKAIRRNSDVALVSGVALTFMAVTLTLALLLFGWQTSARQSENLQAELRGIAGTAAMLFRTEELKHFESPVDMQRPEFKALVERLNEIRHRNASLDDVYILRRSQMPNCLIVVADADAFVAGSVGYRRFTGYQWVVPPESTARKGFDATVADAKPVVTGWGKRWAAYAPILNAYGQSGGAVLALDVGAERIQNQMRPALRTSLQVGALATLLFLLFTTIVTSRLMRQRRRLTGRK